MKRIDTGRAANAYGGPAGGTGHFQDTDPTGGTQFDAEWCEGVQEGLCGAIEGLGGVLSGSETGQLWGLLSPRVDGIKSDVATTGSVTTVHTRAVVASSTSAASSTDSCCVACSGGIASGNQTAVIASETSSATFGDAAAIGCIGATVRREAVLLASRNSQLYESRRIGWGYNTDAEIVPGVVNQNLTGLVNTETGAVHIAGDLKIGGDPDDGTGSTCSIAETTGTIQTAGAVDASLTVHADGLLTSDTGVSLTAGSLTLPTGGAADTAGTNTNAGPIVAGAFYDIVIFTTAVSAASFVFPVVVAYSGGLPRVSNVTIVAGTSITIRVTNEHSANAATGITVNWMTINP